MVTRLPEQEGAEGNVAEKKKVNKSMKANIGKLLKALVIEESDEREVTDGEELLWGVAKRAASVSKRGSKIASVFSEGQFTLPKLAFRLLQVDELAELDQTSHIVGNVNAFSAFSFENTGTKTYPLGEFTVNTTLATDMENIGEANTIDGITSEFIGMMNNLAGLSNFAGPPTNTSEPSHDSPIAQAVDINTKSTSYAGAAGASAKDQPKVNYDFCPLVADPVFDGVNISSPRKVVEKGGPRLIRNSPIILKKWSMDTRLLKEELTRIPLWVKLHDVLIQVFEEDFSDFSLIATFIGKPVTLDSYTSSMYSDSWGRSSFDWCLIEVNSEADIVDVVTIGILSLTGMGSLKKPSIPPIVTTSTVVTPTVEKSNDGFQMVGKKKKRKGKSKTTNGGQFAGPSVKQIVRYEPKVTTSTPKNRTTNVGDASKSLSMLKTTGTSSKNDNISTSDFYSALNDDEEDEDEDVENVYDESANLFPNTKSGGSSSFTAVAG
ncbi:zinc knuckle CX2CX4HX4C containing protein [Tanacetum coccineum]